MDIPYIKSFATDLASSFGVTGSLTSDQVHWLATRWMPALYFHEDELFHSLSLGAFLSASRNIVFPPSDWVPYEEAGSMATFLQEPPIIYASRESLNPCETFASPSIDQGSWFTALAPDDPYQKARDYFGSTQRDAAGDYQLPRHRPIAVVAELRVLRDTLKQNLLAHLDPDYPRQSGQVLDAVRGDFLFGQNESEWSKLLGLITANEQGDSERERQLLKQLDGVISVDEWNAIRIYAFMEYYLIYAYNNFSEYELFGNDHEGDVEGCCLVFERRQLEFVNSAADGQSVLEQLKPHYLMTSAHNDWQHADEIRHLSSIDPAGQRDLTVWVAVGSHASYLSGPGDHHFDPLTNWLEDDPVATAAAATAACLLLGPAACLALAVLAAASRHAHPKDETSDEGVHAAPAGGGGQATGGQAVTDDPNYLELDLRMTPLSADHHVYHDQPNQRDENASLAERAFPGVWGRDSGAGGSPAWNNKTSRFFRNLVDYLVRVNGQVSPY
jgi:hypothetical protein